MVIKPPDDTLSRQETLLAELAVAPSVEQEAALTHQLQQLQNQRSADSLIIRELDFFLGESDEWAVIHDLVLRDAHGLAHINHLLINTRADIVIVERVHPVDCLAISSQGRWKASLRGTYRALPSPFHSYLYKNAMLLEPLADLLPETFLSWGTGLKIEPAFHCRIAVSKQCRILRPATPVLGVDSVVKADQLGASLLPLTDRSARRPRRWSPLTLRHLATALAAYHHPDLT